ncbi:MAG: BTAD domain-containing putative transcriptional regulator [Caldilineaceae bacterium]
MSRVQGELTVTLLGDVRVTFDGHTAAALLGQQRAIELLAWLILHHRAPNPRRYLAFTLWPDSTEAQALTNLRKTLLLLRRHLPAADDYLDVQRALLQWRPRGPVSVDVLEFEQHLLAAAQAPAAAEEAAHLTAALDLYRGDLLPGLYGEWIFPLRERLRQAYMDALLRIVTLLEDTRAYAAAVTYAQRAVEHDPLHEAGYLRLLRLHALSGDRARALRVYHTCATVLAREMGVEPNAELQDAYMRLLTLDEAGAAGASQRPAPASAAVELVGREREWQTLVTCWRGLDRTPVHVVTVAGEAGLGKTRLAEELLNWAERQGILTARARAYAAGGALAFAPISDWLRTPRLLSGVHELSPVWLTEVARLLPELLEQHVDLAPPMPFTESWQYQRLFTALGHALLRANQPLLLLLDDLQWCDAETLTWLHFFLRFAADDARPHYPHARLLLLCAYRDDELDAAHPLRDFLGTLRRAQATTDLTLTPLSPAETSALARAAAGEAHAATRADALTCTLFADTGGNPLYVVETIRAALDNAGGAAPSPPAAGMTELPAAVYALLRARLARLSAVAQEVAGLAAVIGRAFGFDLLVQAGHGSEDDVVQALEELWARRIVQEAGQDAYDFSHDRLRDVAYAELSRPRRRLLHRRVAAALEQMHGLRLDAVRGQIADHLVRGGRETDAVHHYLAAGKHALDAWLGDQAARHFERVLELTTARDDQVAARDGLANARFLLGRRNAALADVAQALDLLGSADHALRAKLLYLQADLHFANAAPQPAEVAVRAALATAERTGDQETLAKSLSLLGQIHSHRGDLAREFTLIERALAITRATGNRGREARTETDLAFLHAQMGDFVQAKRLAQKALAYLEQTADRGSVAFAANMLGRAHGGMGAFDPAMAAFALCRTVADEIGLTSMSLQIPNMHGWLYQSIGAFDLALAADSESLARASDANAATPEISARLNVCRDRLELDGPDAALAELAAIEARMAHGDYGFHGWRWRLRLLYTQGLCHLRRGDVRGVGAGGRRQRWRSAPPRASTSR